jgi:hypothetical protein
MTTIQNQDDWSKKRKEFAEQKAAMDSQGVQLNSTIANLNKSVAEFIQRGGLSQSPEQNPQYRTITNNLKIVTDTKAKYNTLNQNIQTFLDVQSKKTDWNGQLKENGSMQQEIIQLQERNNELKVDADTALARDELLRTRDTRVSSHDLFLFGRPVSRSLVPYLWTLAILFIAVGLFIFKIIFPATDIPVGMPATSMFGTMLYEYLSNNMILVSIMICAVIVIVFLSLYIAGIFK